METEWFIHLVLLFILLLFSALFSGSEVALFSLDKKKINNFSDGNLSEKYIFKLLQSPRRLLVTILLGNTIFNVASSIVAVMLAIKFAELNNLSVDLILLVQIIVLTILILIVGEITPKIWASKNPLSFARIVSIPLFWISLLIFPLTKIINETLKVLFSRIKSDRRRTAILTSELSELADLGVERGTLEEDEQELIHGIVSFKTLSAREVMTPRVDLTSVSVESGFKEVMELINSSGHSRIPLYEDNLDNIIGIIYAKDLLRFIKDDEEQKNFSLKKLARKAYYIPETKLINDLLQEFKTQKMHVGIVVDEYGGTAGLISLEDILEEIVGEIVDEFDNEEPEITKINQKKYLILGKTPIDEVNELFDNDFSSENDDYDTIGGFIFNYAGTIPEKGYSFIFKNYNFTVNKVENKRIEMVLVEVLNDQSEK